VLRSSDDVIDIVERPVDRVLVCARASHAFAAMVRSAGWLWMHALPHLSVGPGDLT